MKASANVQRWVTLVVIVAVGGWFSVLGWLTYTHDTPTSPDEAANYVMAKHWAESGSFIMQTSLEPTQLENFHPRSLVIKDSSLLPGSFVGFILVHGLLLKLGSAAPIIFTMLVMYAALLAWYRIGRRYWEWYWCSGAILLIASLPVVLAHLTLPFTQPALYLGFLILTGWALLRYQEAQTISRAMVVGIFFGLALFIRPVEVLFTGPIIAVVMLAHRKWLPFLVSVGVTIALQIPWLLVAMLTFGAPLGSGYAPEGFSTVSSTTAPAWWAILKPAGGEWSWYFLTAARDYLLLLYPGMSTMALVAVGMYFARKFTQPIKILKLGLIVLFILYYLAYYGSWELYPDTSASRIGSAASYARYWIPLYVGLAAGVIVFLRRIFPRQVFVGLGVVTIVTITNFATWWIHPSGYRATIQADHAARELQTTVIRLTEPDSLIVAGHNEKLFVGHRLTSFMYPSSDVMWQSLRGILEQRSVYILGIDAPVSEKSLREQAAQYQLELSVVRPMKKGPLWKITASPSL